MRGSTDSRRAWKNWASHRRAPVFSITPAVPSCRGHGNTRSVSLVGPGRTTRSRASRTPLPGWSRSPHPDRASGSGRDWRRPSQTGESGSTPGQCRCTAPNSAEAPPRRCAELFREPLQLCAVPLPSAGSPVRRVPGRRIGAAGIFGAIRLESIGYLGYRHFHHHEAEYVGHGPLEELLLSLCFCDACMAGARREGISILELRAAISRDLERRWRDDVWSVGGGRERSTRATMTSRRSSRTGKRPWPPSLPRWRSNAAARARSCTASRPSSRRRSNTAPGSRARTSQPGHESSTG